MHIFLHGFFLINDVFPPFLEKNRATSPPESGTHPFSTDMLKFVELLVIEVHPLEIVIGRFRAASRGRLWSLGALQDMSLIESAFGH